MLRPEDRPRTTPPVRDKSEVPQQVLPQQIKFEDLHRDRLPIELRDAYDATQREREAMEARQGELEEQRRAMEEKFQSDLSARDQENQRLVQMMTQMTLKAGADSGQQERTQPQAQPTPEPDWYDANQVGHFLQDQFNQRLTQMHQAWTKYAEDTNQFWAQKMGQSQAYAIATARLLAQDPEFAKAPELIPAVLGRAAQVGGDINRAYEDVMAPIREKAAMVAQLEDVQKQLEAANAKLSSPVMGQQGIGTPRPLHPIIGTRPSTWGSTGRYGDILARYPAEAFNRPDEDADNDLAAF